MTTVYSDDDLFEWDHQKDLKNKRTHGVSFGLARLIYYDPNVFTGEMYFISEEDRFDTLGIVPESTIVLRVTHVSVQDGDTDRIRIISARKADTKECKKYYDEITYKQF